MNIVVKKNKFSEVNKMAKKANFKSIAKMIVKQVAGSNKRLNCFVVHVDNDVVVATNHYILVISQEVFKRDFKSDVKLGRYENFFYKMGSFDYKVSNMYGTVETEVLNKNNINSIMNMFNEYFVEKFEEKEDKFIPACLTTVNINSHDITYTLFKRKNKSLLCVNKDYIDMLQDTPLNAFYGCSTVVLNDDKSYNPICYRTCYGEVDNKLRYHGFLVLPCSVDADSVLKHVLGME